MILLLVKPENPKYLKLENIKPERAHEQDRRRF